MKLNDLNNKKIALLGLGVENLALLRFLYKNKIKADITICDSRTKKDLFSRAKELEKYEINWQLGKEFKKNLDKFDILFRSPGWPLEQVENKKLKAKSNLTSPMRLFFDLCPTNNIIGVTGTKGKGTTSSLIYSIIKTAKKKVWLGGNIGVAPFEFISKIKKDDWVVLELSSFQLEDMDKSPRISVITNFSREHLAPADPNNPNYHKSLKAYWEAKANIFKWQKGNDLLVINQNLKFKILNLKLLYKIIYFEKFSLKSKLPGEHNKENIAAAVMVAKKIGISDKIIAKAVANFKGLPHRIELVSEKKGVKYYDDSFATTPDSAIIAIRSFCEPVILLAGGADKGADFKKMAKEIVRKTKFVVLLDGKATPKIKKELLKLKYPKNKFATVFNINEAIHLAANKASEGDVVLLSTGCASFGMFKNYKERGDLFKLEVNKIK